MAAVEIVEDKASRKGFDPGRKADLLVREVAWRRGLPARATGDSMAMSPPPVMTRDDVDEMVDADALDAAQLPPRG